MKQVTITTYESNPKSITVTPFSATANRGEQIVFLAEHVGSNPPKLTLSFPCPEQEYFICQNGQKKLSIGLEAGTNPSETVEVCSQAPTGAKDYGVVSSSGGGTDPVLILT